MRLTAVLCSMNDDEISISGDADKAFDRRRSTRRPLRLAASSSAASAGDIQVLVRDISPGGLLIEAETPALAVDDWIEVSLPDKGVVKARVAWTSGRLFGCEFTEPVSVGAISAALLKAEPQVAEDTPSAVADVENLSPGRRLKLVPELNFSTALYLSLALWAVIGAAVYFLTR